MAKKLYEESNIQDIANAIREKNNTEELYKVSEMGNAIRTIEGGFNGLDYVNSLASLFTNSIFDKERIDIIFGSKYSGNIRINAFNSSFYNATGAKYLKVDTNLLLDPEESIGGLYASFRHNTTAVAATVEVLDLPIVEKFKFDSYNLTFRSQSKLKEIIGMIDAEEVTIFTGCFYGCYVLEDVRFKPNSISVNLDFPHSKSLSNESIQSIIDGLVDLTGKDAQTLVFHSDVVLRITDEQTKMIGSKNWSVG